jgi:uncharacterized membrane protein YeaQ/YmgE (transglycosylase-associated protein family)
MLPFKKLIIMPLLRTFICQHFQKVDNYAAIENLHLPTLSKTSFTLLVIENLSFPISSAESNSNDSPLASFLPILMTSLMISIPILLVSKSADIPCHARKVKFLKPPKKLAKRYLIDAFTGMSQSQFVTLIAGLIIKQLGTLFGKTTRGSRMFIAVGNIASLLTGPGIAKALSDHNFVIFAAGIAGMIGAWSPQYIAQEFGHTGSSSFPW